VTIDQPTAAEAVEAPSGRWLSRVVWTYLPLVIIAQGSFATLFDAPALRNWATIFVSLTLQALPFLVMGVIVSATISALVPASWLARALPRRTALAVPTAGLAGALLPGCECSSVPVAGRLVSRGIPAAAALTFLLAAPAINPIVLVSTAVAFPGDPEMVLARFLASLVAAVTVGFLWSALGRSEWMEERLHAHQHGSTVDNFVSTATSDFLQAGGFLVAGAALVATLQTLVPQSVFESLGGDGVVAIVTMAGLAVLLSVCSEADAFVAAGLTQFSLTSRLVFLVVGPMVDLKLVTLQAGSFGRRFAARFAPLTLAVAVTAGVLVGTALL
jgi:uncharacterized membrane protein YraQ (UPF0718 family)